MNMHLATTQKFGTLSCDFWSNTQSNKEVWMTRKQIGEALEYSDPQKAIDKIHAKQKERLDLFSVTTKLVGTDGKLYDTYLYSAKGVFEICRRSRQAKADEFFDWVWDIIDGLRTGSYKLSSETGVVPKSEFLQLMQDYENFKEETRDNNLALAFKFEDLEKELIERTEALDRLISAKGCLSMNQVAKTLGIGRNTMMEILRYQSILMKDNSPYEKYVKAGYFIVTNKHNTKGEINAVTRITAKGVKFIMNLLDELKQMS
jgi:phage antirepressor YoqD-like protein